jgi:glyoxylase-like metal-dependent hydrolase (beta-lactamase superfamily II)
MHRALPPQVHVFVRDWLNANHVLLKSADGHVLVDSGYVRYASMTLALVASPRGLAGEPLAKLVNTHCHSDHIGGNAAVKRAYGCPIALPENEAPQVERWDQKALLLDYADQRAERFGVDEILRAGSTHVWGGLEWQALAAPGHAMHALVFYNPEHRILISGDALWENGYGFVMPRAIDPAAMPATRATLEMIAALEVRIVIPGHGDVFTEVTPALDRAFRRATALEADDARVARHALKALLTFCLLDQKRLPLASLPAYVDRVGVYRDFNAACLGLSPDALAAMLVEELVRSGVVAIDSGALVPARSVE